MVNQTIVAVVVAFVISAGLMPAFIPFLRKLKFGQEVRQDGPKSHLQKQGTPTMGGIVFLIAILAAGLVSYFVFHVDHVLPILFVTVGFGLVGFLDDYLKVVKKQSEGLKAWQKLLLQIIISAVFIFYVYQYSGIGTGIRIPFLPNTEIKLGWLYIPFGFFVLLGTDNGVNFSDGLDGLCSSITIVVAAFFAVAAIQMESSAAPICGAVIGALMGFLIFNCHPAKVFMGDTGSLALGGFVAATAMVLKMPLFIIIVGIIYLVEILSVMLQVSYFKLTHGKRIFKMAPIHHHFELCGWSETKVVTVFTIVTALACLLGYVAIG